MADPYAAFLARKRISDPATGLKTVGDLPSAMFPHQRDIAAWALRRGRAAVFAGTGLGKSLIELAWADTVARETGRPILHMAPLAVSAQLVREGAKWGLPARLVKSQDECGPATNITNYHKIDHFDLSQFGGVILDESSILKNESGHYRTKLIEACAQIPFRLAATATPAPNDFMELGNHAEFLGVMSYTDMLATFFTHDGGETQKWRLKGHAEDEFWKWMASWAVMLRKPSDLGYSDEGYDLPPLTRVPHIVRVTEWDGDGLFAPVAASLSERLKARRASINERVQMAVDIVLAGLSVKIAPCQQTLKNDEPICAHTTPLTKKNSSENLKRKETPITQGSGIGAKTTPHTQNIFEPAQDKGALKNGGGDGCEKPLESEKKNTTPCLPSRADDAPCVLPRPPEKMEDRDFASITTTEREKFEDSCVAHATGQSDNLRMTSGGLEGQSTIYRHPPLRPWVIWCHLNDEQAALTKALGELAISIHGGHSDDEKEALHQDWLDGKRPVLIVKPSMFGHGLNWQRCADTIFVGLSDSFEQVYQAERRFWRFGQTKPVNVHMIYAETEGAVIQNLKRKQADADRMAAAMVRHMQDLSSLAVRGSVRDTPNYNPQQPVRLPAWLGA